MRRGGDAVQVGCESARGLRACALLLALAISTPRGAAAQPVGVSTAVREKTAACLRHLQEQELEAAIERCDEALREEPAYAPARVLKVRTLVAMRRYADAVVQARAGDSGESDEAAELASWLGFALVKLGRAAEARAPLERAVARRPGDALALLQLCKLHQFPGLADRAAAAVRSCEAFLRSRPEEPAWTQADVEAWLALAYAHETLAAPPAMLKACRGMEHAARRPLEAVQARICSVRALSLGGRCDEAVQQGEGLLSTRNAQVYQSLTRCRLLGPTRDPAAARRYTSQYRDAHPVDPRAFLLSALVELAASRPAAAAGFLGAAEAVARGSTERVQVGRQVARILLGAGDLSGAEQAFRRTLALGGAARAELHHALGTLVARRSQAAAIEPLETAARLAPAELTYCLDHGTALRGAGKLDAALHEHQRCTGLGPREVAPWLELAADQVVRGELDAALRSHQQASQLAGTPELEALARRAHAGTYLARALQRLAGPRSEEVLEQAAGDLQQACALDPASSAAAQDLAIVRLLQNRPAEAERTLGPWLDRPGAVPAAIARAYARALETRGELAGALTALSRAEPGSDVGVIGQRMRIELLLDRPDRALVALGPSPPPAELRRLAAVAALGDLDRQVSGTAPAAELGRALELARARAEHLSPRERRYLGLLEGSVLLRQGQPQKAERLVAQLGDASDDLAGALEALRARAAYAAEEYDRAYRLASAGLARASGEQGEREALREIAGMSLLATAAQAHQQGLAARASEAVRRAARFLPADSPDAQLAEAVLAHAAGKRAAAERALRRVPVTHSPELLANLGILAEEAGDARAALDYFRRYLGRNGRNARRVKRWVEVKQALLELEQER